MALHSSVGYAAPAADTPPFAAPGPRVDAVDVARFIGICLVYYGHVVEQSMYAGNSAAAQHYKLIYSFHMPLFFVLSGIIAKDWDLRDRPIAFLKTRLASRVVSLLFFSLVLAVVSLVDKPVFPPIPLRTAADYGNAALRTITRFPVFDVPTWFLMCLVSVEIIHALVYRFLRWSDAAILAAIIIFYLVGYALNRSSNFLVDGTNYWFWNEAVTMYAFYLVGVLLARRHVFALRASRTGLTIAAAAALAFVTATYGLNDGPFRLKIPAVVILAGAHGQIVWFVLTALAGTAAILLLSQAASSVRWLGFLGRNALILFCLNGIVYHHVNTRAAHWFAQAWPQSGGWLFLYAGSLTAISIAAAVPFVLAFNRYVPQLVGRPNVAGPWLPALVRP